MALLLVAELGLRRTNAGWERVMDCRERERTAVVVKASGLPLRLCAWSVVAVTVVVAGLAVTAPQNARVLVAVALVLAAVTAGLAWQARGGRIDQSRSSARLSMRRVSAESPAWRTSPVKTIRKPLNLPT